MLRVRSRALVVSLGICLLLAGSRAFAQHGGGGERGGGGMGMRPGFGAPGYTPDRSRDFPKAGGNTRGSAEALHKGPQLALRGRWWDDKQFAKSLKLRPDQQGRMDAIFEANRPALAKGLEDLQTEQNRLDAMYRAKSLDENTLYAQIDRVSQARAELGKVYTHFQLQLRAEMATDQLSRLDEATRQP